MHLVVIGEIIECWHPRLRFMWKCGLGAAAKSCDWHTAGSTAAAIRAIENGVNDFLYRAGLLDPGVGVRCVLPDEESQRATARDRMALAAGAR